MPKKRPNASETEGHTFPTRLRAAMDFKKENQTSLASKVNMKRQTIGFYMNGQSQPNADGLAAICRALQVSSDWLLGLSQEPEVTSEDRNIFSYFGENAVTLLIEKSWGESARADFMRRFLSAPEYLDKLIEAVKARQREERERNIAFDLPEFSLKAAEEEEMRNAATKILCERYFWKIVNKAFKAE